MLRAEVQLRHPIRQYVQQDAVTQILRGPDIGDLAAMRMNAGGVFSVTGLRGPGQIDGDRWPG